MAKKRKNRAKFAKGSRLYAFSYAMSSMRAYPFRALSLALTLSLGVSLIGSVMIWSDTGIQVSVDGYFETNAFQMLVTNPVGGTAEVDQAHNYAASSNLIESVHRINSTVGLVEGTNLPDSTFYGLDVPIYTYGMKDCEVIFVNNDYLETVSSVFEYDGLFSLNPGEVLVSTQFVIYYHEVFGLTLTVNSTIDVEVLMRRPTSSSGGEIGNLGRTSLDALKVVGIYEVGPLGSMIDLGFPSRMRSNYDFVHFNTAVLGIRDSIMVLSDTVDGHLLPQTGFFGARSFVRASGDALIDNGVDLMAESLLTLKARLDEQFDVTVEGLLEILHLQNLVDTYVNTMPLALLNLPIFILALFLSIFAADTFMSTRNTEVSALRSKGASSTQVYGMFITESVIMAVCSLFLGLVLSVMLGALIPSATAFMVFDWDLYNFFLMNTVLTSETIMYTILLCLLPPLLFILNSARKASHTEIGTTLMETADPISTTGEAYGFTLGASIVLFAMVLAAVLLLPSNPFLMMVELVFGTAAWFFFAYNGSRIVRIGFAKITARLGFLLGEKNLIAAGNLRMRKGRIVPLMVVLALTLSSTIAFTVQAESYQADLEKEIRYAIGSDLRVSGVRQPFSFNDSLEAYPGVNRAVPVLRTWGQVGTEQITIEALDAIEYSLIGHFDQSSFLGEDASFLLSRLSSISNGLILSSYHANRWNKTIGDTVNLNVGGRLSSVLVSFELVGLVYSAPGFGFASITDMPASQLGAGFGFQAARSGFAFANLEYIASETDFSTADLFLADLVCVTDQELVLRALRDLPGISATTPEDFDLNSFSFGTALFLSTVEGLFSIGFAMSLILSMFALTLFLGSIVRERKRDYAILRAVGGSKAQIVKMVLSEFTGIVIASLMLSLILGTLFGYVMSIVVFSMSPFARVLQAVITFPIGFLTTVLLLEIIVMILGAYLPAREAAKTDPAIVLRNL